MAGEWSMYSLTEPMTLSPELAAIVCEKKNQKLSSCHRIKVVKRLWAYIKANNLQDPANKQWFTPDKKMAPVFGTEKIWACDMSKYLQEHMYCLCIYCTNGSYTINNIYNP